LALEQAMIKVFLRSVSILRGARKLGVLLLQLSPAFSPHKHKLEELEHLIEMLRDYPLAIEFRNRNWVIGEQLKPTIDFLKQHDAVFVNVDGPTAEHFTIMPSDLDEITRQDFSKNLINVLQTGASNLTLADTNEEAANSQALSTRQSIAVSALALANQSQASVLQLLR